MAKRVIDFTDGFTSAAEPGATTVDDKFSTTTGHDHDGTDSKKVLGTNIDSTGGTNGQLLTANGSGASSWTTLSIPTGGTFENFIDSGDRDAETDVGSWVAYADAAGVEPVDGTGGSPNVTITRTASAPLNGIGSFLLTKDAANRQGEGCSLDFSIPEGYTEQTLSVVFPYQIASGTFADDDVQVFVYDVTGAALATIESNSVLQAGGRIEARFTSTTSTSYRLILHVVSTSTSAYTVKFDDVKVVGMTIGATSGGGGFAGDSFFKVNNGNGHGSTDNRVRRFDTVVGSAGSDISHSTTAANGTRFTINTAGLYYMSYSDRYGSGSVELGITLNQTLLTTGTSSNPVGLVLAATTTPSGNWSQCSAVYYLEVGDVIRASTSGSADSSGTTPMTQFNIRRIA